MGEFVVLTQGFKKKFEIYLRVCIYEHMCMWGTAEVPLELDSKAMEGFSMDATKGKKIGKIQ